MELSNFIKDIVRSFETSSKNKKEKYRDFLLYVYVIFENLIKNSKIKKLKNKYIQMRTNALKYIIVNERAIMTEIHKNK